MRSPQSLTRAPLVLLVLAALLAATLGCGGTDRGAHSTWPAQLAATGRAEAPGRELLVQPVDPDAEGRESQRLLVRRRGDVFPGWAGESLHSRTRVAIPERAPSQATAHLLARREAIDRILSDFALEISRLPAPEGGTVADQIIRHPELRDAIETAVRSSAIPVHGAADDRGNYEMILRLPLEPIALVGWGEMREEVVGSGASGNREQSPPVFSASLQAIARERAENQARSELLTRVQAVSLYPNYTIQDLMAADAKAVEAVHEAVGQAKISGVRQPMPGVCEVDLVLEMSPLLRKLNR